MELFTNSQPLLITEHVSLLFNKMLDDATNNNKSFLRKLYDNVIYPNIYFCIMIAIIFCILVYMYHNNRKTKKILRERLTNINNDYDATENVQYIRGRRPFGGMDAPNERIARPILNPSIPISQQHSYVNYLPDEIPVNVNGVMVNNIAQMDYTAPNSNRNTNQYSGPYYSSMNNVSDDSMRDFRNSNKQNLMEYDDLLDQKIYDV